MAIGIYKITNNINSKNYIGQSVHINQRINQHKNLRNLNHGSAIDYAIKKYGWDNFTWEIIEECLLEELNEKEIYWINFYNSLYPNGYNITTGGKNGSINYNRCKEVSQYDINGNLIKTFYSIYNAAEETNYSKDTISDQCNLQRTHEYDTFFRFGHNQKVEPIKKYRDKIKKEIYMYDLNTKKYIQSFNSVADASKFLGDINYNKNISSVANGKRNKAYNYYWSYLKYDEIPDNIKELNYQYYLNNKNN